MWHFAFYFLKSAGKTIFEVALEHYAITIIKNQSSHYLTAHIDEICKSDEPKLLDTYAARSTGYISKEEAMKRITNSNTELANNIKQKMHELYQTEDFVIVKTYDDIIEKELELTIEEASTTQLSEAQPSESQPSTYYSAICTIL